MTPEEARELLDGTTYIPWEAESLTHQEVDCPEVTDFWITGSDNLHVAKHEAVPNDYFEETQNDFMLIAAAPDMAATIAGMTTEYRVVALDKNGNRDFDRPAIYQTGEEAETRINHLINNLKGCFRIEKRTVTEWEPA